MTKVGNEIAKGRTQVHRPLKIGVAIDAADKNGQPIMLANDTEKKVKLCRGETKVDMLC